MRNQKDKPLVSIVTPVYAAERFIEDTIRSVRAQTYRNWELLLVDDCSIDGSAEIIREHAKKDKRIKLIRMKKNGGAALARNAGTKQAKGRYLAFLDSDDLWVETKLQRQVDFMQEHDHAFTYTSYEFADDKGVSTGKQVCVPASITYKQALRNHIIWTSTVMIDLQHVKKETCLMPDVRRGQDAATWWQILRAIGVAYGIDQPLSHYRRTSHSLSANKLKAMKRTWYLLTQVERLGFFAAAYSFGWYGFNAVKKRV